MSHFRLAAIPVAIAVLAGCHAAPGLLPGGSGVTKAARPGLAPRFAFGLNAIPTCPCPLRLTFTSQFVTLVDVGPIPDETMGTASGGTFEVVFNRDLTVSGGFKYDSVDYTGTSSIPGVAEGDPLEATFTGGFSGFLPFDGPPNAEVGMIWHADLTVGGGMNFVLEIGSQGGLWTVLGVTFGGVGFLGEDNSLTPFPTVAEVCGDP